MLNLTLEQLFGKGAIQDSQTLTIQKASLPKLIASGNNRAEQLLVALILQAWQYFEGEITDHLGKPITDHLGKAISYDNRTIYEKLNVWFWKEQFVNDYRLKTFVIDAFIKPPTELGSKLNPDTLVY